MPAGNVFMVPQTMRCMRQGLILCGVMSAKQLDREDELLEKGSATVPPVMGTFYKDKG